jgi:hypothetical protein
MFGLFYYVQVQFMLTYTLLFLYIYIVIITIFLLNKYLNSFMNEQLHLIDWLLTNFHLYNQEDIMNDYLI